MAIPPLPPLRIKEADGSPNVIPVFQVTVSNMTLIDNGGGKVTLDGAGGTGPQGPAGTVTIGSGVGGGVTGSIIFVDSSQNLGQDPSQLFWNDGSNRLGVGGSAPLATLHVFGSGIFESALAMSSQKITLLGYPTAGSDAATKAYVDASDATILPKVDSSRTISTLYPISGGGNLSANRTFAVDTAFLINSGRTISTTYPLSGGGNLSADRTFFIQTGAAGQTLITSGGVAGDIAWVATGGGGSSVVYAATGNAYVVMNLAADLTGEFRLAQSGNSITITTAAGLVTINATTGDLSTKQDAITFPLGINSGGTGLASVISATNLIGFNSSSTIQFDSYRLVASDNMTILRSGTAYLFSATTNAGGGSGAVNAGSATYLAYYPASGTTVDDAPASISTGAGIAPFNVTILTSAAANLASGDIWFQSSSNRMYLGVRSSSTTYYVALDS